MTVIVAGIDADLEKEMRSARFILKPVDFTPFDAAEAAKIPHFDTYNRTAASQRVADIVEALRATPDAVFVGSGDAALAGLLAPTIESGRRGLLDIGEFDTSNDAAFVERLYMPGLRRAGDSSTAASLVEDRAVIHNAGPRFALDGVPVRRERMSAKEIGRFAEGGNKVRKNEERRTKTPRAHSLFLFRSSFCLRKQILSIARCESARRSPSAGVCV